MRQKRSLVRLARVILCWCAFCPAWAGSLTPFSGEAFTTLEAGGGAMVLTAINSTSANLNCCGLAGAENQAVGEADLSVSEFSATTMENEWNLTVMVDQYPDPSNPGNWITTTSSSFLQGFLEGSSIPVDVETETDSGTATAIGYTHAGSDVESASGTSAGGVILTASALFGPTPGIGTNPQDYEIGWSLLLSTETYANDTDISLFSSSSTIGPSNTSESADPNHAGGTIWTTTQSGTYTTTFSNTNISELDTTVTMQMDNFQLLTNCPEPANWLPLGAALLLLARRAASLDR